MHNCVQGWTSIGEWSGLPLAQLADLVRPLPQANYVCFLTMQDNSTDEPASHGGGQFYEVMDLELAYKPQTLLAYEMNGKPLPIKHGAHRCGCGWRPRSGSRWPSGSTRSSSSTTTAGIG